MKKMVYKQDWNSELLEYNTYKGYNYAVVSQGVFPCGYVEIPKITHIIKSLVTNVIYRVMAG